MEKRVRVTHTIGYQLTFDGDSEPVCNSYDLTYVELEEWIGVTEAAHLVAHRKCGEVGNEWTLESYD